MGIGRAIHEDHVVEIVDRFEAQNERRVAVLLQNNGGKECRLEAVRGALTDDAAEAAQRRAAVRLLVVWQSIEEALDEDGRSQPRNQPPLARREVRRQTPAPFLRSARI